MSHTPGPWTAVYSPGMKGPGVHIRPHKNAIDIAYANSSDNERPEADARLIAAAPEAIEALEELLNTCGIMRQAGVNTLGFDSFVKAREKAFKVIAKARGES